MTADDTISTGPAVSWLVPRALLVLVVLGGALVLSPVVGWVVAAVALALIGAVLPHSFAAWGAILCFLVGMLIAGPDPWRGMCAVLAVHLVHVLASLLLVIPPGSRVLLAALTPTLVRLLGVQLLALPITAVTMIVSAAGVIEAPWAIIAGASALAGAVVLFTRWHGRGEGPA